MSIEGKQFKSRWRNGDEAVCKWLSEFQHGQQADVIRLALYLLAGADFEDLPRELQFLTGSENLPSSLHVSSSGHAATDTVVLADVLAGAIEQMGDKLSAALAPNPTPAREAIPPPGLPLLRRDATTSSGIDMSGPRPRTAPRTTDTPTLAAPFDAEQARRTLVSSINAFGKGER